MSTEGDDEDGDHAAGFALCARGPPWALEDVVQGPGGEKALELVEWAEDASGCAFAARFASAPRGVKATWKKIA